MRSTLLLVALAFPLSAVLGGCAASEGDVPTQDDQAITDHQATDPAAPRQPGTANVDGMVDGAPFHAADAVVFVGRLSTRDPSRRGIRIVLGTADGACASPDVVHAGARTLSMEIDAADGTLTAGNYTVPAPFSAGGASVYAQLETRSMTCASHALVALNGGTVTIDSTEGHTIKGSFALVMGREKVRGTFVATSCDARPEPALDVHCVP